MLYNPPFTAKRPAAPVGLLDIDNIGRPSLPAKTTESNHQPLKICLDYVYCIKRVYVYTYRDIVHEEVCVYMQM